MQLSFYALLLAIFYKPLFYYRATVYIYCTLLCIFIDKVAPFRFGGKLPLFLIYFTLSEHTYNIYIYNSSRTASCCLHRFRSVEGLLWGAEPRFELGPALQQADALLFVPRRTLKLRLSCGVFYFYFVVFMKHAPNRL
jgi:hypothetical protein